MRRLIRRLYNALRRDRIDSGLREELEFHREMRTRKARARGAGPDEAEREASRKLGGFALAQDRMRDERIAVWLANSLQDLRHGARILWREAPVSALIVLALAAGIGASAAIFTLFEAAFLRPLPYRDAGRLVTILDSYRELGFTHMSPTVPEALDAGQRTRTLEHIAFLDYRDFQLTGGGEPERVFAARVTDSFFPLLGVAPRQGRVFEPRDRPRTVIVSDSFWRTRMSAVSDVTGATVVMNDETFDVIGVLPPGFRFDHPSLDVPEPPEIYVPFPMDSGYTSRSAPYGNLRRVRTLARLKEGSRVDEATQELAAIARDLAREHPAIYRSQGGQPVGFTMWAQPLREAIVGRQGALLWLLAAAVAVLLLIACANTAQLLLAQSLKRNREVAIRAALGAGRARLIRQFLLEGALLAFLGGAVGLLLSVAIVRLIVAFLPLPGPLLESATPGPRVFLFTIAVSASSAILFAALPAIRGAMRSGSLALVPRLSPGEGNRMRHAMIAVEAALAMFLLCGAGLVSQNLGSLVRSPAGFDTADVAVVRLRLPYRREQELQPSPALAFKDYLDKIAAVPGVEAAATVTGLPLRGAEQRTFQLDSEQANTPPVAFFQRVSPDYFRVLGIPLLAGRTFRDDDSGGREGVAIVNREFVRRYGGGRDPIGRRITQGAPALIVGVVGDVRMLGVTPHPEPQVYRSYRQGYEPNIHLVVRSPLPLAELGAAVKAAIRASYPGQAIFEVTNMDRVFSDSIAAPRFQTFLTGLFALLALAMAGGGIYSVISCLVSQRTNEIAIRIALGSSRAAIVGTMLSSSAAWVAAGLGAGFVLALAASNTLRALSGVSVHGSPWMYAAVAAVFIAVSAAAAYAPARRAAGLDPARALRCE